MADELSTANINRLGDRRDKFLNDILKEIDRSEEVLRPWKQNLVKYYELYKMYQRQRHYDGLAQLFIPEILRAVETFVSNGYRLIFGSDPSFEYVGRTDDEQDAAEAATQLVNFQMDENGFKMRVQDSLRQMAIAGLTVRKVLWDFHQIKRKRKKYVYNTILDEATGQSKRVRQVEDESDIETVRDHWTIEPVDLLGFYISDVKVPYFNIQKADWIAEEYEIHESFLHKQLKKNWYSDAESAKVLPENLEQHSNTFSMKEDLLATSGYKQNIKREGITIYERWGLVEAQFVYDDQQLKDEGLEPDDLVEAVIIIANRKYILKLAPNPFWHGRKPYLSAPFVPQEGEFAGIGMSQIGQSLQEELNDTRNQVMDNKTLNLMCMWLKNRASGIKNQDLKVRPLGVINTNDMNGLMPLRPPVLSGVGVNIEGVVKNDLRESVGAPSNLQGIAQSGVSTATESTQINSQALGRLTLTIQLFAELILKPLFIMVDSLNEQFYDGDKAIKVLGVEGLKWKQLSSEDIWTNTQKDVVIKLASDLDENPGIRRQQALQFLTIVQQIPPQMLPFYWKFLDKLYKMFFPNGHDLADVFDAPAGEDPSLDPNDENEVMAMGKSVDINPNDDDDQHIQAHMDAYNRTKYALSNLAHKNYTSHILKHHQQKAQKIQAQAQQIEAERQAMVMAAQGGSKRGGAASNPLMVPGQTAGMTAFTQPSASTQGNLNGNTGA